MSDWEYLKGSEADFEGAPEWATHVTKDDTNDGALAWEEDSKTVSGNKYQWQDLSTTQLYLYANCMELDVIAERRKVDNLQSRVNDANLEQALDTVQRPAHYNQSGIECIDAIAASMTADEFRGFLKGNVQKYVWREGHKGNLDDLRKAKVYLDKLISIHDDD